MEEYGKNKADIEEYLFSHNKAKRLNCTVIHPGHISGKGWLPINPQGNLDKKIFDDIMQGREIILPFWGLPTLQHVHSEDIAGLISTVIKNKQLSAGQSFHAVAKHAVTMRGYAEMLYFHYGHKPAICYVDWNEFKEKVQQADISLDHILHSPCCSMDKAKSVLGFEPKYDIIDTVIESLEYNIKR